MIDRRLQDAIDYICGEISRLEEELDHEENVEHDRVRVFFIKTDLDNMKNVLECLYELKQQIRLLLKRRKKMTKSIDKRLEALDVLVKLLNQIDIEYIAPDMYDGSYILKLIDNTEDKYCFWLSRDELDILKEVLDNIKKGNFKLYE